MALSNRAASGGPGHDRAPAAGAAAPTGDPPAFRLYFAVVLSAALALVAGLVAGRGWQGLGTAGLVEWWLLCALSNILPVPAARNIYLSMSSPVNIAIAFSFHPGLAAAVVLTASVSEWEVKRETTPSHALFNRSQLALSTAVAAVVFHTGSRWPLAASVLAAVVLYQTANWALVALAERTSRGVPIVVVLRRLVPTDALATATYLALGLLGVVLALTQQRVGVWAVGLLMIPLLGARQAVRASRDLEQAERDRRQLADQLVDERERERTRIASDIHDVVLQDLAALQLQADNIASAIGQGRVDLAAELAVRAKQGVGQTVTDLRRAIANLRRTSLDEAGLVPTLERFARAFGAEAGVEVTIKAHPSLEPLPLPVGLLVYECAQEALTNVARHARASRVRVSLAREGDQLEVKVRDDGVGVDPTRPGGFGLELTREKLALSGGACWVDSRAGQGTTLTFRVPVAHA